MTSTLTFRVGDSREIQVRPKAVYCIGDSGRTAEGREAHLAELEKNGISPMHPGDPPMGFSPVSPLLLTQDAAMDVLGGNTTGEVEFVLFQWQGELYVTVGSDHADRVLEAMHSDFSKQVCAKPVAGEAWRYRDVAAHWDEIRLRLFVEQNGEAHCAQQDAVSFLSGPETILAEIRSRNLPLEDGCFYFCGTILLEDSVFHYGDACTMAMEDPVTGREITHTYRVNVLKAKAHYIRI